MRTLTTPIARDPTTIVTLDGWSLTLVRDAAHVVQPKASTLVATLRNYTAAGEVASSNVYRIPSDQASSTLISAARAFHNAMIASLTASGAMPPGTDTPDF